MPPLVGGFRGAVVLPARATDFRRWHPTCIVVLAAAAFAPPQVCRAGSRRRRTTESVTQTLPERFAMTGETFLIWIVIGLIAGWLASAVVGGGYGVIGDIVVGIVGAFLGGLIFRGLHIGAPFGGIPGTIFIAFIGALVLLVILRLVNRSRTRIP